MLPWKSFGETRKNRPVFWIAGLVILLMMVLLGSSCGRYLVRNEAPVKADMIVVFSGDKGSRMETAADLYRQGYAPVVLISGGEFYTGSVIADVMKAHAERLGVPDRAILLERESATTRQNVENTLKILKQRDCRSVLVVTSNYHTRRVGMELDRFYHKAGIKYRLIASDDPEYNPDAWWSGNKSALHVVQEYVKLAGYWVGRAN